MPVLLNLPASVSATWPLGGYDFSFYAPHLDPSTNIQTGTTLNFEAQIINVGTAMGSVLVTLIIKYPDGTTVRPDSYMIYNITAGGEKSVTLRWDSATSPSGDYYASANISAPDRTHSFDFVTLSFEVYKLPSLSDRFVSTLSSQYLAIATFLVLFVSICLEYRKERKEEKKTEEQLKELKKRLEKLEGT